MLSTAALILIVTSKVVLGKDDRIKLDMAKNSVDDRYDGCTEKMANLVKKEYLNKEIIPGIPRFSVDYTRENQDNLNDNHLSAIYGYTSGEIYNVFNHDVRNDKQKYKNRTFKWYSLHFFLTEAIQILKKTQMGCKSTYRGTNAKFKQNIRNKEIRFGSFTSSSFKRDETTMFGSESCFEIETCYGADVTKYSQYKEESEVLIPPYETFKVTAIRKKGEKDAWCNTVFVLKSSGIKSNLNCAVASVKPNKFSIKSIVG